MNTIDRIIEMMRDGAKISYALEQVCGNQRILIPFTDDFFDIALEELELSTRSFNALKREKINTLNDVIQRISANGWSDIKNFGRISATEVFEAIVDFAWDKMNNKQRAEFLLSINTATE